MGKDVDESPERWETITMSHLSPFTKMESCVSYLQYPCTYSVVVRNTFSTCEALKYP